MPGETQNQGLGFFIQAFGSTEALLNRLELGVRIPDNQRATSPSFTRADATATWSAGGDAGTFRRPL